MIGGNGNFLATAADSGETVKFFARQRVTGIIFRLLNRSRTVSSSATEDSWYRKV